MASSAVTVTSSVAPALRVVTDVVSWKRTAAAETTLTRPLTPIKFVATSLTIRTWAPSVCGVTLNTPCPAVNAPSAGRTAAASVLAKVTRDRIMVELGAQEAYAGFGWVENKGYAAPEHLDALRRLGPCELHRRSWRLPGTMGEDDVTTTDLAITDLTTTDLATTDLAMTDLAMTDLTRVGER